MQDFATAVSNINALDIPDAQKNAIIAQLVLAGGATASAAPAKPAPTIAGQTVQIDPVVPPGTEGTITLPKTGHVVSVPRPDLGETFGGYGGRISQQVGGDYGSVGALMYMGSDVGATADSATWPEAVDKFFNQFAYATDADKAKQAAAQASLATWHQTLQQRAAANPEATAAQKAKIAKNKADAGTPVPIV